MILFSVFIQFWAWKKLQIKKKCDSNHNSKEKRGIWNDDAVFLFPQTQHWASLSVPSPENTEEKIINFPLTSLYFPLVSCILEVNIPYVNIPGHPILAVAMGIANWYLFKE